MICWLKRKFDYLREYGIKCTVATTLTEAFPYVANGPGWKRKLLQYKHKTILKYLNKYASNNYNTIQDNHIIPDCFTNCIWTAWLQGERSAPEVIQLTLASIKSNSNGHTVIVITNDNVDQYIELPEQIKKKYFAGIIGNAHYADIIRMLILAKYGGVWLDATMLLHEPIDEDAFNMPFYSVGFVSDDTRFISGHRWLVGLLGGIRGSKYLYEIASMLISYWKEHIISIDYFVFDYLIALIYQNDLSFCSIVDSLPRMGTFTNTLRKIINEPYDNDKLTELNSQRHISILSYKYVYQKITSEGSTTYYGMLCNQYLNNQKMLGTIRKHKEITKSL